MPDSERLDGRLNLVLTFETNSGDVYVHATPIGRNVFERYYRVMASAWASLLKMGGAVSARTIAAMELRQTAIEMGVWDGEDGVERGLMAEIRRLTNVVTVSEIIPLESAVAGGTITEDDCAEIEGAVVFFTLASSLQDRRQRPMTYAGLTLLWDAQTVSSDCSAFLASLRTSTETETSSLPQPTPDPAPRTFSPAY